uniref:Uncharacterized protein n=1 Tax=Aegilops tauschii subsp. strangulata TaxID=200361 RepID=A0A452Y4Z1_AEGTS
MITNLPIGLFVAGYANTHGLEYICPHFSIANYKKPPRPQKVANGLANTVLPVSRNV